MAEFRLPLVTNRIRSRLRSTTDNDRPPDETALSRWLLTQADPEMLQLLMRLALPPSSLPVTLRRTFERSSMTAPPKAELYPFLLRCPASRSADPEFLQYEHLLLNVFNPDGSNAEQVLQHARQLSQRSPVQPCAANQSAVQPCAADTRANDTRAAEVCFSTTTKRPSFPRGLRKELPDLRYARKFIAQPRTAQPRITQATTAVLESNTEPEAGPERRLLERGSGPESEAAQFDARAESRPTAEASSPPELLSLRADLRGQSRATSRGLDSRRLSNCRTSSLAPRGDLLTKSGCHESVVEEDDITIASTTAGSPRRVPRASTGTPNRPTSQDLTTTSTADVHLSERRTRAKLLTTSRVPSQHAQAFYYRATHPLAKVIRRPNLIGGADLMCDLPLDLRIRLNDLHMEESALSRGTFGTVYRGTWKGQSVAVKWCHTDSPPSIEQLRNFEREVNAYWALSHTHICAFYGACVDSLDTLALVTEYMPGGNVFELFFDNKRTVSSARRLTMARQLTEIVAHLHTQWPRVIHRDIKTPNLILDAAMNLKLCDFGKTKFMVSRVSVPFHIRSASSAP